MDVRGGRSISILSKTVHFKLLLAMLLGLLQLVVVLVVLVHVIATVIVVIIVVVVTVEWQTGMHWMERSRSRYRHLLFTL
jgi:hypothetical protein